MKEKRASFCLFLLGAFSMTQIHIIGSIGISELVIYFIAPKIFIDDYIVLKNDGFMPVIWLSILMCIGCIWSSIYNQTAFPLFLRGFAAPYSIFSVLIIGHHLLRKSLGGYKWFCLGMAVTVTINIFVFQRGVEADIWGQGGRGLEAVEGIMNGPLFWVSRINAWANVPIRGWYLQTPIIYSIVFPIFMFFFAAFTTESGRSAAATSMGAALLVILGGKRIQKMKWLSKNFWLVCLISLFSIQILTNVYKTAALKGLMGEKALKKYEHQMRGRKENVIGTLMGGRIEFFSGLYAASQHPIVGYGPWAIDKYGYYDEFLAKYGTEDDYKDNLKMQEYFARNGIGYFRLIGAHSHLIGSWLKYGFLGMLFWLYVIFLIVQYFRKDLATVPQWFGLIAVSMPAFFWNILFSPLGDRVWEGMLVVFILMARAVRMGRVSLPPTMIEGIVKMRNK